MADSDRRDIRKFEEEYRSRTESSRTDSNGPKKRSKYSNFYYKLEALNEKIKVYKEVFYSRENYFIGNKRDPRYYGKYEKLNRENNNSKKTEEHINDAHKLKQ